MEGCGASGKIEALVAVWIVSLANSREGLLDCVYARGRRAATEAWRREESRPQIRARSLVNNNFLTGEPLGTCLWQLN